MTRSTARFPARVVPPHVTTRLRSPRAYDADNLMIDAIVREGVEVAAPLERLFANREVAYVHLHNAKRGCSSCVANRV